MSPVYLSPGVYVEEVDRGSKPIEGVGTAVAAFVGFAEKGPVGEPTLVTNWSQFTNTFGGFFAGGYLAPAVYGYFNNGGGTCLRHPPPGRDRRRRGQRHAQPPPPATAALPRRPGPARRTAGGTSTADRDLDRARGRRVEIRAPEGRRARTTSSPWSPSAARAKRSFPNVTLGRGRNARNVVEVVNRESKLVQVAEREATAPWPIAPQRWAPTRWPASNPPRPPMRPRRR